MNRIGLKLEIAYCRWSLGCTQHWQRALAKGGLADERRDRNLRFEEQRLIARIAAAERELGRPK